MGLYKTVQRWNGLQIRFAALLIACLFAGLFALTSEQKTEAATTLPTKMNFQGRITNSAGNILANGTYNMRFKIWDSLSGGSSVWSEDRLVSATQGVTVTNGQFSVQLGEITSLPASVFNSNSRYFEVELPTPATATSSSPTWTEGAMTPRNQLATSAYAYNAETLDGIDGASFAQIGTGNAFSGANTFSGTSGFTNTVDVNVANANALRVRNGATNLFNVDTTNSIVSVGTSDTTGAVLVLDVKTGAGDPAGGSATNGAMYYNSNANKFRCYQNGWIDCITINSSIASGNTAGRPGSPTEGTQYFDTDTDRLLVYANGKWQADRTDAIIVASSTSSQADRDAADYVTNGNTAAANDGDQIEINSALTAASGKKVVLLAGTYTIDASVQIPNDTTLTGVGNGTLVQLATINATDDMVETTGTGKTGQILRDMRIDGGTNASGTQRGISILNTDNMRIDSVTVSNMRNDGLYTNTSTNLTITNSTFKDNDDRGVYLDSATENVMFENNIVTGSVNAGLLTYSVYSVTINDNVFDGNPTDAIVLNVSSSVTISSNTITDNSWGIAVVDSNDITVSANSLLNNTAGDAIHLTNSNRVSLTDNRLHNNGAGTAGSGIKISNSDDAYVTGNSITDTAGTGYAIDIDVSTSDNTYLSNNVYSGTGAASINNAGTNTRYGGQLNGSSNYLIQPAGTIELMKNTNVTGTLGVSSSINAVSGYSFNGTSGSTVTCSGGQVLSNQVVQGGIVTGGSCVASSGSPTLQDAYNNSSSPATITTTAAKSVSIAAGAAPTADLLTISNVGQATTTADANGLEVDYVGGAAAVEGSGIKVDLTPGTTSGGTWSGLRVVSAATGPVAGVTSYGIKLEGPSTQGAGQETGMYIGTGWDTGLDVQSGGLNLAGYNTGGTPDDPPTPAADNLRVYAKKVAGRMMLKWKGSSGVDTSLQPNLGFNTIWLWAPASGTTAVGTGFGNTWPAVTGSISHPTVANTNVGTSIKAMQAANVVTTTNQILGLTASTATLANVYRGNAAGRGGFFMQTRFKTNLVPATTIRLFVGLTSMTTGASAADTVTGDTAGLSHITTDNITTMAFMTRDNTTTNRATFTVPTIASGNAYDFTMYSAPNGSEIYYRLVDLLTGSVLVDSSTTTNLPRNTIFMGPQVQMSNGTANILATTTAIGINKMYLETDN